MDTKRNKTQVSIPHRLATNYTSARPLHKYDKFQFLIGWLQTEFEGELVKDDAKFQFLIGWLQTILR